MKNPFERVFKANLEDDAVFDARVQKEAVKIIDEYGVNAAGIGQAYRRADELNRQRKTPHHKNYLLNLVRTAALSSHRFDTDGLMNPNVLSDVQQHIEQLKREG
jgi:hypothetical protein